MTDQSQAFLNLEQLIKNYIAKIETAGKELREKTSMLNNALEGDVVYSEQSAKAKEANKIKSATKAQILKTPALAEIAEKIKDLKFDLSEDRVILSDYLAQYQKQSGATQIELGNGEVLEIVNEVRLVKRSPKQ